MNFNTKPKNILLFSSIDAISEEIWSDLSCEQNLYFHRNFLKSIEKNHPKIKFFYLVLIDKNKKPKAFVTLQIIDFHIENAQRELNSIIHKIKNIDQKLQLFSKKKTLQLLICGNTFVSGEHGIFISKEQNKKEVFKEVAEVLASLVTYTSNLKIDAFLVKDFVNESLLMSDTLKDKSYHPFSVEPNMVLKLSDHWQNFDDYLASMKTKYRVKAKKAFQLSDALKIEEVTLDTIETQLPKMTALYQKVTTKAAFNLSDFKLATYKDLKLSFGDQYILKTYWLQNEIVGFMSGLINEDSLDAHFVGIDYNLNREHAIYQRMLYDYIEIAIQKNLKMINFGRTASEIKSSVGAIPQDLTMYLRHKKSIRNKILKLFLQHVKPTTFQQKFPFKQHTLS